MNKRILILGGTGFLGNKLYEHLNKIKELYVVRGSVHKTKQKKVQTVYVDVLNRESIQNVCKSFDIVINCTGQVTVPITRCLDLNTIGISNIVYALKNTNKSLIHISTVAVYGTRCRASETSLLHPETPYAACKVFSEYLLKSELSPKQLTILRLSNLYGDVHRKASIFSYLYKSYKSNRKLVFDNNGELSRYYLHVDDCAEMISMLVSKNLTGNTYNLIGPRCYKIVELIDMLQNCQKMRFNVEYTCSHPIENINRIDDKKIQKKIHVRYKFSVERFFKDKFR